MQYEMKAPPVTATGGNRSYKRLLDVVRQARGSWVEVQRDEIKGYGDALKRAAIKAAATRAGFDVEVRFSEGRVYVAHRGTEVNGTDDDRDLAHLIVETMAALTARDIDNEEDEDGEVENASDPDMLGVVRLILSGADPKTAASAYRLAMTVAECCAENGEEEDWSLDAATLPGQIKALVPLVESWSERDIRSAIRYAVKTSPWAESIMGAADPVSAFAIDAGAMMDSWRTSATAEARRIAECLYVALGSPEKHRAAASSTWVDAFFVARSKEHHPYPLDEVLAMIAWSLSRPRGGLLTDLRKVSDPVKTLCGREWIDLHQEWEAAQQEAD